MSRKYKLNLDKNEFRDDYIAGNNLDEFWQDDAKNALLSRLTNCLGEAKEYHSFRQGSSKTWLSHNAILVSGQRGTGKTVFLRNSKAMWESAHSTGEDEKSLYFLDVIDPTMLINEDTFANVIVAQIYSEVEKQLLKHTESACSSAKQNDKNKFTYALKKLADSLGKSSEFNGYTGIDKIQQYKSGIHIESFFHQFVEIAINILGCKALVLPIDDVDMALDRAFEVVDDVRRLLGCPYIIPIVSGDMRLYEHMTHVHFDDKAYKKHVHNKELTEEGLAVAKELTTAYLTKVFPNQMRISLQPISRLIPNLTIAERSSKENFQETTVGDYEQLLFQAFYPLCHNDEALHHWPKPESSRELVQLIRSIPPRYINNTQTFSQSIKPDLHTLWNNFIIWAEQKKNGVAFTNADSYLTLLNQNNSREFNIQTLLAFNPRQQINKELYPWAKKNFYQNQLTVLESLAQQARAYSGNKSILDSVFKANSHTLRSMPPLEFYDERIFISQKAIDNAKDNPELRVIETEDREVLKLPLYQLLLDIYTHGEVYSTLRNTYQFIFFSRAFELIAYSCLKPTAELSLLERNIAAILNRVPFYSIFSINQTKPVFGSTDQESTEEEQAQLDEDPDKTRSAKILTIQISNWQKAHENTFNALDSKALVALLSYMFNKTFTAFAVFKYQNLLKSDRYDDEHLSDLVNRFSYMLVNSAYTAGIQGESIPANVAISDNHATIRDQLKFEKVDNTLRRNKSFLEKEAEESEHSVLALNFCRALEQHPVLFAFTDTPQLKLGKTQSNSANTKTTKTAWNIDPENNASSWKPSKSAEKSSFSPVRSSKATRTDNKSAASIDSKSTRHNPEVAATKEPNSTRNDQDKTKPVNPKVIKNNQEIDQAINAILREYKAATSAKPSVGKLRLYMRNNKQKIVLIGLGSDFSTEAIDNYAAAKGLHNRKGDISGSKSEGKVIIALRREEFIQ
ncbi:antiviral RADAR system adenosine triphosphatase RdrA [Pseudoalteromonas peptidolytica]|uniref:Uncharacterized protein n=1 Tax=Pseudoalteromonas peptidolytica F12-50-A1 TaxID=1315280 RepID=A0A8I0N0E1_9GAMM|nr:antiviral RADAR system adenosine triphosphatase RdrA [Pseudoalteromonas peptidolytica]MBE0348536.1 hypothetical protein [Pseudoalteromonas peptidolytica F12-50-A1]NLR17135.1 hypothetical protein [Pseudoalteromonas peptidolytica]GEK11709.1 hypothetical protein PPE03_39580 [Pseudoalteromonas peptidolytica]